MILQEVAVVWKCGCEGEEMKEEEEDNDGWMVEDCLGHFGNNV